MLSYFQAVILGVVQGVTEIFPVSSLGHSVLIANLFGWHDISKQQMADASAYVDLLTFMQLAIGLSLCIYFRKEWSRILPGMVASAQAKNFNLSSDARLGWLLLAALIPTALIGLLFERGLRSMFATTFFVIICLVINGILLLRGDQTTFALERHRPRERQRALPAETVVARKWVRALSDRLTPARAAKIGAYQIFPLFAGISRTGVIMLMTLRSGLNYQESARFAFLLTAPIALGAGLYKLPTVLSSSHNAPLGPIALGAAIAGIAAYLSVRYLDRYFANRTLRPFGWYCIVLAAVVLIISIIRGSA